MHTLLKMSLKPSPIAQTVIYCILFVGDRRI